MKAWDTFLSDLEQTMGTEVIKRWLRPLKIVNFDACNLYLEATNPYQVAWFKEHVLPLAKEKLLNNRARPIKIHFSAQKKPNRKKTILEEESTALEIASDPIDPSFRFTNFISNEDSALVTQFFRQLSPGAYNPIFVYGPPGNGKTHLLMAYASVCKAKQLSVFFVHAETFTEHVVKAIRSSQMRAFREIYRHQDVLIIDDIHFLARRAATQEELFHTFNALHTNGKQIILSSHLPPSQLEDIEPRLISRFEWGIILQLPPLSPKNMEEVLKNRARLHHFPLSESISHFLIDQFSSSSKSLMRALEALMLRHRNPAPISLEQAKILLKDLLGEEEKVQLTPDKILQTTSAYFGIRTNDILGKSQQKEIAFPRKLAMYLCRKKLNLPYLTIGKFFGRDHSTVMTSIKQIDKKKSFDEIEAPLNEIKSLLNKN